MTVKQIALSAAALLSADDTEALLRSDGELDNGEVVDASSDADVRTLVKCVNMAAAETVADGFPVLKEQSVSAVNGHIDTKLLPAPLANVAAVKQNGAAVGFGIGMDGITVERDGEYTVTYSAAHEDKALGDELETGALCDAEMLAYLTARNYCLIVGRTDDAAIWDQFYSAHSAYKRLSRRAKMPARRWRV